MQAREDGGDAQDRRSMGDVPKEADEPHAAKDAKVQANERDCGYPGLVVADCIECCGEQLLKDERGR